VIEREQIQIGIHVNAIQTVLTRSDTKRVLRAINQAGADTYLRDHPLEHLLIVPTIEGEDHFTLGVYRRRIDLSASIVLNANRSRSSYGQPRTLNALPSTISSLAANKLEALQRSLLHELGHHLIATSIKTTALESLVLQARKAGGRVSQRADDRHNWQEYFCECFVAHTFEHDLLFMKDPAGFAMMVDIRERLGLKP
jgi:hypothetical protein